MHVKPIGEGPFHIHIQPRADCRLADVAVRPKERNLHHSATTVNVLSLINVLQLIAVCLNVSSLITKAVHLHTNLFLWNSSLNCRDLKLSKIYGTNQCRLHTPHVIVCWWLGCTTLNEMITVIMCHTCVSAVFAKKSICREYSALSTGTQKAVLTQLYRIAGGWLMA